MNRVCLIGRLTNKPELRQTNSNLAVTRFTLAVNRNFSNSQGQREADFITIVAWRKQAENICRYLDKGSLISVEGRIQTRNFTGQDGVRRFVTEVVCDNIQFLEPKQSTGASNTSYYEYSPYDMPQQPRQPQQPKKEPFNDIQNQFGITDDDLPF